MNIVLLLIAGGLSALIYFGGLWWTVQRLTETQHPSAIYLGSLALRLVGLLGAVWLAIQLGQLQAVAAFFVGFLIVRAVAVRQLACFEPRASKS